MSEKQSIYHAPHSNTDEDDLNLLASKVFNRFSWQQWSAFRELDGLPIKCNQLTHLRQSLLEPFSAHPLYLERGAYIDFHSHLENVYDIYSSHHTFILPTDSEVKIWDWKLSWDNFKVHHHKHQAWTLTPLSVIHNQQPQHAHVIMFAAIDESNISMK